MEIRKTKPEELNILIRMYENARIFMASHGNPLQWGNTYPAPQILMDDISSGNSYVCVEHDKIIATFYYKEGIDDTYVRIYEGQWLNEAPVRSRTPNHFRRHDPRCCFLLPELGF